MKRILIVSDTHGEMRAVSECYENAGRLDGIIHLGDNVQDAQDLACISELPSIVVRGNCDLWENNVPETADILIDEVKVHCVHGHMQGVKFGYIEIIDYAKSLDCDILFFGHTHKQDCFWAGNVLCINPGSIARPRGDSSRGYAIAEFESGNMTVYLHDFDEKTFYHEYFRKKCE